MVADGLGAYNALLDVRRVMPALMEDYVLAAETPGYGYGAWRLALCQAVRTDFTKFWEFVLGSRSWA